MSAKRGLVLDANILLRAVFGKRVWRFLESVDEDILLCTPDHCFQEALKNIPMIAERRGVDASRALKEFEHLAQIVESVDASAYSAFRDPARQRIARRDPDDWPVVAVALMLQLPIWTEDLDFFGIGIATWVSDRVEIYLRP
jgi:predicted nucleic acid-binding protein